MRPFTKILVPVDFSPHSAEAIRYAGEFSRRYEADVTLVHVFQPVSYLVPDGFVLFTPTQFNELTTEFEKQLAGAKDAALSAGATRVETKLLQGAPFEEIVDLAREGNFDLIVMGTHGRTGLKRAAIGSVAERVVRKAPCPVLVVHKLVETTRS
jgi:nucleotide-binding universal stress UspA family protein